MHLVAAAVALVRAAGICYGVEIGLGEPAAALADIAECTGCEQIIIGALGQGGLRRVLIGSVSREVARNSRLPVTIVKHAEPGDEEDAEEEAPQ
jgi:nucleotide-binding universal stress UspA family protein